MNNWEFALDQEVRNVVSGEEGKITGRAEYLDEPNYFRVEYTGADGKFQTGWFLARQLEAS